MLLRENINTTEKGVFSFVFFLSFFLFGCSKQDEPFGTPLKKMAVQITLLHPNGNKTWDKDASFEIIFNERNTYLQEKAISNKPTISCYLPVGFYTVTIKATQNNKTELYRAFLSSFTVTKTSKNKLELFMSKIADNPSPLVIAEIFPTGTLTPDGKQFDEDKYLILHNQSDETIYLDGICISTSPFLQNLKIDPIPNISYKATAADAILQIPGEGKDYPLAPYSSVIISDNANDHLEGNTLSWNATISDFEFFWPGEHDDIDNPDVPNLKIQYSYIVMNNQASQTFFVWKLPPDITIEKYLSDYKYYFYWMFIQGDIVVKMEENEYYVPNEWILDAINLCPRKDYEWISTSPTIDCSFTYCADIGLANDRYRHAVIRKIASQENGKVIYKDTNDSANDFYHRTEASMLREKK